MNRKEYFALKVMELASEFTGWDFQMEKDGNSYLVGTALSNQQGQEIFIYYLIEECCAELRVISLNNKYDYEILKKKINKIALRYPVYAMGVGENGICIHSPMSLDILDRDMTVIIRERMVDMIQAMTELFNHCN